MVSGVVKKRKWYWWWWHCSQRHWYHIISRGYYLYGMSLSSMTWVVGWLVDWLWETNDCWRDVRENWIFVIVSPPWQPILAIISYHFCSFISVFVSCSLVCSKTDLFPFYGQMVVAMTSTLFHNIVIFSVTSCVSSPHPSSPQLIIIKHTANIVSVTKFSTAMERETRNKQLIFFILCYPCYIFL